MKKLIITVLALAVLLVGAYFGYNYYSKKVTPAVVETETQSEETNPAPDFTVYDTDRHAVHFKDMLGKPIIINIWATWCMPCREELPDFQKAYEQYGEDITFMMINLTDGSRDTVDGVNAFIEENGYTFPYYYDMTSEASNAHNASAIPKSVFIDANGNIVAEHTGYLDAETMQSYIDMLAK